MNFILLSGGSGQRLWPLSNDVRAKQFIKIFGTTDGNMESMLQRVYRQIQENVSGVAITIATSKSQVSTINNQIGEGHVNLSIEPCRRDTFPAIVLAAAYLKDIQSVSGDEIVIVCPIDPYVETEYFRAIETLGQRAEAGNANLVLMGIEPTYPSGKYGYIIPATSDLFSRVAMFKEKPTEQMAAKYIAQGALWNGGVFAFKLDYVLNRGRELIGFCDYYNLIEKYEEIEKISFDYAVVEHEKQIEVMRFRGIWKDLGTWNTFTEVMNCRNIGEAIFNDHCENTHVINELNCPVLCMGLKNVVVAASPSGVLVSDKEQSSYIKPFAERFNKQVMLMEKSWGSYRVLNVEQESITIKVTLKRGHRMHYHSHELRDEVWTIISGEGRTIVDGIEQKVGIGDVVAIAAGCRHTVIADTELQIIEVQLGKEIDVHDKRKYKLEC